MAKVLVIYSSQSGNTESMAKAVAEGAKSAGATVVLKKATDAGADDVMTCDVLAVGTPNYFGYMSGLVKDFFDRAWIVIRDKVADKPYCTFGSKGGGGAQSLESVERICDGLKMRKVADGLVATRQPSTEVINQCKDLGKKLAKPEKLGKVVGVDEPRL
jgi:flavorubredoxin